MRKKPLKPVNAEDVPQGMTDAQTDAFWNEHSIGQGFVLTRGQPAAIIAADLARKRAARAAKAKPRARAKRAA